MRSLIVGLFAALLAVAVLPAAAFAADASAKPAKLDPDAIKKGMAAAPDVITGAALDCKLANARLLGKSVDPKTKAESTYYELACANAEGFVVGAPSKAGTAPYLVYTCLEAASNKSATCVLPENADPKAGLAPLVAQDEPACQMTNVRALGHNDTLTVLEIACQNGAGYVIDASYPFSAAKPATFNPCAGIAPGGPMSCTLTDATAATTYFTGLVGKMGKPCDMKDHRYVGADSKGNAYFEVACNDGKGYIMEVANTGGVTPIDCTVADNIGGGCTLTNARQAQTEQAALYSRLAHGAGFACDVSKYATIPANLPGKDVDELVCSNRPDGAVGIFGSGSEKAQIDNCAVSELAGFRCSFTKPDAAFPLITADLKKLGKDSCVVSGTRPVGTTPDQKGFLEVACADGNPGYMVTYSLVDMSAKDATACSFAKDLAGGCTLPTNQKKG